MTMTFPICLLLYILLLLLLLLLLSFFCCRFYRLILCNHLRLCGVAFKKKRLISANTCNNYTIHRIWIFVHKCLLIYYSMSVTTFIDIFNFFAIIMEFSFLTNINNRITVNNFYDCKY